MRIFIVLILLLGLTGCQTMTALDLKPKTKQQRFYDDGAVSVASRAETSLAIVAASNAETPNGQRIQLALKVENIGNQPFDIDTSNIRVVSSFPKPIKVYSYDQLAKEERDARNTAIILSAIAGAANSYSAAQASSVTTSGSYNSNTYGPAGSYSTTGNYSSTTYDPLRGQIASDLANQQTSNQINNISQGSDVRQNNLRATILKRTTVFPQSQHAGLFVFDAPALKQNEVRSYKITVNLNGERHTFNLVQQIKK